MKKISQVLLESQSTRKQGTGGYRNEDDDTYCAVGALACEVGEHPQFYVLDKSGKLSANRLFSYYGVSARQFKYKRECFICGILFYDLHDFIVHLNDGEKLTFEQIGEYMKELGF